MAAAKITAEWDRDVHGQQIMRLKKKRGKITLDDIEEFFRYENGGIYQGNYVILIKAGENTCGGSGWMDDYEDPGDVVELYQIEDEEKCPVCGALAPPQYYPECGTSLKGRSEEDLQYICDCLCKYPNEAADQEELDGICEKCRFRTS